MKYLITTLIAIGSLSVLQSQTIRKTIKSKKFGSLKCEYNMMIRDVNTSSVPDTMFALYGSFQNRKYQTITDIGIISVYIEDESKSGIREMIENLEKSLKYLGEDVSVKFGNFQVYDFSSQLYVQDDRGKYTVLTKRQVGKLIEWLKVEILEEVIEEDLDFE